MDLFVVTPVISSLPIHLGHELRKPPHNPVSKPSSSKKTLRQMGQNLLLGDRQRFWTSLYTRSQDRLGTNGLACGCLSALGSLL